MTGLSDTERDGRTILSASVAFSYRSSDGYSAKDVFSTVKGAEAKGVLIEAVDEIARIAALFEFGDEVVAAAQDACKRVADWRAQAKAATLTHGGCNG